MQYFQSMYHYGIISSTTLLILAWLIFSNRNSIGLSIKSLFTYAYQKNSNATIIDWIQDRGVITVTEIVTDQEDNFVSHVEHWTSNFWVLFYQVSKYLKPAQSLGKHIKRWHSAVLR